MNIEPLERKKPKIGIEKEEIAKNRILLLVEPLLIKPILRHWDMVGGNSNQSRRSWFLGNYRVKELQ